MAIFEINPLTDARWGELLRRHPAASLFHTCGWLEALRRTYGFEPAVFTTSGPGEALENGLVFCRVRSWLTGKRLVSLPFSDHCEPLVGSRAELEVLLRGFADLATGGEFKYAEVRPVSALDEEAGGFVACRSYSLHVLDLREGAKGVFNRFHKDCIQRKIRRADREGVVVEVGNGLAEVEEFYRLMVVTRRRHGLPPPPFEWFLNLSECLREAVEVWLARKGGRPAAAIVTFRQGKKLVYKYGASDEQYHRFGVVPALFWAAIQDGAGRGLTELDLGRSDDTNPGLIAFKDHWGAARSRIIYWRKPVEAVQPRCAEVWKEEMVRRVCEWLPGGIVTRLGGVFYRHVA